jgi:hypothetical protein
MTVLDKLRISDENGEEINAEFPTEFEEEFAPDPAPDEKPRRSRKEPVVKTAAARRTSSAPTNARLARQAGEDLAGIFEMMAAAWSMAGDRCCAPVLEQQAKPMGTAIANILKRYPNLLAKLAGSDLVSLGVAGGMLVVAVKPVVQAVYVNHVSKDTAHDHDAADDGYAAQFPPYSPGVR